MPSCRMSGEVHSFQIEAPTGRVLHRSRECFGGVVGIGERDRPSSGTLDTTVFDVPDRDAFVGKRLRERLEIRQIVIFEPASTVNHHHHRVRAVAAGQVKESVIVGAVSVGDT